MYSKEVEQLRVMFFGDFSGFDPQTADGMYKTGDYNPSSSLSDSPEYTMDFVKGSKEDDFFSY